MLSILHAREGAQRMAQVLLGLHTHTTPAHNLLLGESSMQKTSLGILVILRR